MKRNRNHSFGTQSPKKAEKKGLGQAQRQQCPALLLPETFPGRQRSLGDTAHSGILHPGITRATQGVLQLRCHAILQPATDFSRLLFCPNSCFLPTDRKDSYEEETEEIVESQSSTIHSAPCSWSRFLATVLTNAHTEANTYRHAHNNPLHLGGRDSGYRNQKSTHLGEGELLRKGLGEREEERDGLREGEVKGDAQRSIWGLPLAPEGGKSPTRPISCPQEGCGLG